MLFSVDGALIIPLAVPKKSSAHEDTGYSIEFIDTFLGFISSIQNTESSPEYF
jgi:hypothetical protein